MLCQGGGFEVKKGSSYNFNRDFSIAMTFSVSDVNTEQGLLYKGTGSDATTPQLSMSYRRAWLLIDTMNRCFRQPVTTAEAGGKRGGGTSLTPLGMEVVRRYRRIERAAAEAGATDIRALIALLSS